MERRKILLGSGAALATVLAGCSSSETGEENDDTNDDSLGGSDDDNNDDHDKSDDGDIPGFADDALDIKSDKMSVKDVKKDGDQVDVVVTTTTTDRDVLVAELESLANDIALAITDPEAFVAAINSVTWILEQDGTQVMSFYIDVQWALQFANDEIDEDEFVDLVLSNSDEM